ncbi:MAG: tetraacyldisaccharide 4'-kinase [Proteobacteria bacterium]|nr:tetraacyldisaccharide 4'-kinase [Pseudomonadota bacterium]
MWKSLHDAWWRLATQSHPESFSDALVCGALRTGSVVYQAAVTLRNLAYDKGLARQITLPCRVVSVGNLTVGGTGKTACVELISKRLAARGKRVAVLSRGYGGRRKEYWLTSEQGALRVNGEAREMDGLADEPQLLAHHLDGREAASRKPSGTALAGMERGSLGRRHLRDRVERFRRQELDQRRDALSGALPAGELWRT